MIHIGYILFQNNLWKWWIFPVSFIHKIEESFEMLLNYQLTKNKRLENKITTNTKCSTYLFQWVSIFLRWMMYFVVQSNTNMWLCQCVTHVCQTNQGLWLDKRRNISSLRSLTSSTHAAAVQIREALAELCHNCLLFCYFFFVVTWLGNAIRFRKNKNFLDS